MGEAGEDGGAGLSLGASKTVPPRLPMLKKRSFTIARHRTSVALEPQFWAVLENIAAARGLSLARLVAEVDAADKRGGLASALRLHALAFALDGGAKKEGPRGPKAKRPKSGESM